MKTLIWAGILLGGTVGGIVGGAMDRGLGAWSIILSSVGSLAGIWAGFQLGKRYF